MRSRKLDNCDKNPEIFVHLSNINEFFRSWISKHLIIIRIHFIAGVLVSN
jgi:hypothetical protein